MSSNYLILNPSKTESFLTNLLQQTSKIINPSLSLLTAQPIVPTPSANNLGFILTPLYLSLSRSLPCQALVSIIFAICRIRYNTDFTPTSTIATSLVHPRLDYCNSLYCSLPVTQLKHHQQIQNAPACAIIHTRKHSHITPALKSLHWLKI